MQATRPPSVSADATCIPPSVVAQQNTIASIEAQNAHNNYNALQSWAHGMQDWAYNAQANHDAGQPVPNRPQKPPIHRTEVTYADQSGVIQTGPHSDDGQFWAWVETVVS